ncbi:MAG: hypothetical protein Q8M92_06435 [Candidatus Subteraquimicrobiales bacterium]|nr:hypothetical protein [Candidatus Subteraquimicrobiales bacterium]
MKKAELEQLRESRGYKVGQIAAICEVARRGFCATDYQLGSITLLLICRKCKKAFKVTSKAEDEPTHFGLDFYSVQINRQLKCKCNC